MNQPDQNNIQTTEREEVLSIGQWLVTTFVIGIPIVGLVMIFVWGFGQGNKNRSNFCKAILVWYVICIAFSIIFGAAIIGMLATFAGAFS